MIMFAQSIFRMKWNYGRVLVDAPKRPTLSMNAVPCIFPGCPKYLMWEHKSRNSPRRRQPTTTDQPVAQKVVLPAEAVSAEQKRKNKQPMRGHSRNFVSTTTIPHHARRILTEKTHHLQKSA